MSEEPTPEEIARLQKENCIFCKIIKGEIPSRKVYEDDLLLAILDINPATKGHTLVMPKEHYPILPVIPPDVFKHTFRTTKYLLKGVRDGMITTGSTVFIANGAVAGQQSPHFLFHVIPRDHNDGLSNFSLPEEKGGDGEKLTPSLQMNIAAIMRQYLEREGLLKKEVIVRHQEPTPPLPEEGVPPERKEEPTVAVKKNLAETILANEELKELIMSEPDKVKELVKTHEEYRELFHHIDIDKLSLKLRELQQKKIKKVEKKEQVRPDLDSISRLFR